ncbi:MAG: flagellar filament outer layer protein FlaA [Treponemataceae bacterium]
MKKFFTLFLLISLSFGFVFAQNEGDAASNQDYATIDAADPAKIGITSAEVRLKEISVDKFETEGTWKVAMSSDEGVIEGRLFDGSPLNKEPIEEEADMDIPDTKVYGAKISFYRRGMNSFTVKAAKPLPVEGITKTVSVWVVGRSIPHELTLIVEDFFGQQFEIYVGKLNHAGWKLMTAAIPPQGVNAYAGSGIIQRNTHYGKNIGLKIVGFKVNCDLDESYGKYYIYFDDLRAVTDLYEVEMADPDDMDDNW